MVHLFVAVTYIALDHLIVVITICKTFNRCMVL